MAEPVGPRRDEPGGAAVPTVPTGRLARGAPLVSLGARTGLGRVGVLLRPGTRDARRHRSEEFHVRTAERYAALLGDMKGALMKAGQLLSFVDTAGILPEEHRPLYQQALQVLQADAPPMEPEAVSAAVEAELGRPPGQVFDWFSPEPVAAASIGQVHAARLDGRQLAVKVQYPGVAEAIRSDLANTDLVAGLLRFGAAALPGFTTNVDVKAVAEEICERVVEELDYGIELRNQREFADLYRDHPFIRIPEVVPELSTARVLTMDFVDGRRFQAACQSSKELRDRWGEVVARFVYGSLFRFHLFNADPHPGNYLFHEDGTVTFLDFGCVKRFSEQHVALMRDLDRATLAGDAARLHRTWVELGLLDPADEVDPEQILGWYRLSYEPLLAEQPYTYTREFAAGAVQRHFDPFGEWRDVVRHFRMPREFVFLNRIIFGLFSVVGMLEATCDWRANTDELLDGDPPATELGRREAAWLAGRGLA